MNTLRKLLSGFLALSMLSACSNDPFEGGEKDEPVTPKGGYFFNLDIAMPSARTLSRSETLVGGGSSDGTEIGQDYENYVSSALIVLASTANGDMKNFGYIASAVVQSNDITDIKDEDKNASYSVVSEVGKTNLEAFYQSYFKGSTTETNPVVYVFVFCNPTADLMSYFTSGSLKVGDTNWINKTCKVVEGVSGATPENAGIWGQNSMLMNNARLATRLLPSKITDWDKFAEDETPFHLSADNGDLNIDNSESSADPAAAGYRGAISVERSVARFDFKDGSENNNTYSAVYFTDNNGNVDANSPIVDVQLQKMCLVNMSNSFYYVPRVSNNGQGLGVNQTNLNEFAYCGVQRPWVRQDNGLYVDGNYVVGPYNSIFGSTPGTGFTNYFNYPFFENSGTFNDIESTADRWDVMLIDDVLNNGVPSGGDFKIWRYVTENVIPADETRQVNGISTGVVFKGRLLGSELAAAGSLSAKEEIWEKGNNANIANCLNGKPFTYLGDKVDKLTGSSDTDPIFYYINGRLYMGWKHIRQAAIQASVSFKADGSLTIDKSNPLYKAVFGSGPIPPTGNDGTTTNNTVYVTTDGQQIKIVDPDWTENPVSSSYAAYLASPNYLWEVWMQKGRPSDGDGSSTNVDKSLEQMRAAIVNGGTSIFQSSVDSKAGAGYYCYYYFWVRHNDNENNGVMGPMEFDVVRNNVYKISVNSIARLGHPRIPANDPQRPRPQTPDESEDIYFDVTVDILPWAVRNNYIDFE